MSTPNVPAKQVSLDNDEDILDLLSGLSDKDDELTDIANHAGQGCGEDEPDALAQVDDGHRPPFLPAPA